MASWQAWKNRFGTAMVLGVLSAQAAYADAVISVSGPATATVGSTVSMNVLISGVADLYGYQLSLNFNPALLRVTGVTEGSFMVGSGATFFDGGTISNTTGTISYMFDTLLGTVAGASGGGVLATITFSALSAGTSALTLSNALLQNSTLTTLPVTLTNGSIVVSAVPEPATMLLFGLGLAGVAGVAARRRQAA